MDRWPNSSDRAIFQTHFFVSLVLPLCLGLILVFLNQAWSWQNEAFHSAVEGVEAIMVIVLALFLKAQKNHGKDSSSYHWIISGLFVLGLINLTSPFSEIFPGLMWSRTLAHLLGGLAINAIWLPPSFLKTKLGKRFNWLIAAVTIAAVAWMMGFGENTLAFTDTGHIIYRWNFKVLNVIAGLFFWSAAIRLSRQFPATDPGTTSVLINYLMLYGVSRVLIGFTVRWGPAWWYLYTVRMATCALVLIYLFSIFRRTLAAAETTHLRLERKVQLRTDELARANAQLHSEIQDKMRAEESLRQAIRHAKEANEIKSAFLANMSHEIRTPLGAVLGFTDLLRDPHLDKEEKEKCFEVIHRNGLQLSNLIDEILDLSKVEAGEIQIENTSFQSRKLFQEVCSALNMQAKNKNISFHCQIDDSVPLWITSDPTRLRQILMNILGNAIKFTDRGFVQIQVSAEGPFLRMRVQDTGVGMNKEQMERIFQPFTQAEASTTRKFGGTGLGLNLSKKLAQALGGDLRLQSSAPGVGSIFEITIRLCPQPFQSPDRVSYGHEGLIDEARPPSP